MKSKKIVKDIIVKIIFFIIIALIITSIILIQPLSDFDEMWNYNFSKNILEGRLPYKDFNMINMPLVPYLGTIFLMIFGNQMLSMRIFAIVCCTLIIYFSYKILETVKVNKSVNGLIILGLIYLFKDYFRIDYNFFLLLILLLIIYIELKNKVYFNKVNHKIDILLGFLAGLCIGCKQTTGICVAIVTFFYPIMLIKDKETFKVFIRKLIDRIIGIAIPIGILIIYFTIFGLWNDFIDYCILGIRTFSNKISYLKLFVNENWYIKILSMIVPLYIIVNILEILISKVRKKYINQENLILLAYSCASIVVVYPISDEIHFLIGSLPVMLSLVFILYKLIEKIITKKTVSIFLESFIQGITFAITIYMSFNSCINLINYFSKIDEYRQINHFWYIPDATYSRVEDVDEYIKKQDRKVYILDPQAVVYTIPIDQYNKDFDMFNKGNLGTKGEKGIIEEIKDMQSSQFFILKDEYTMNWQTPMDVINYVKNNLVKIGNVGIYDIYEK